MSFRMSVTPTFRTKVTVNVANEKGGFDKSDFVAVFKRPATVDEKTELASLKDVDLVRRQLVGWEMRDQDSNEEVPFTSENLELALSIAPTPLATAVAFWDAVNGARAKN